MKESAVMHWRRGDHVIWRSRPQGQVGYVIPFIVIEDSESVIALYQVAGSVVKRRSGQRGGPRGRSMLPGGWDGNHVDSVWAGPGVVRLHPVGSDFSVIRVVNVESAEFQGWYVNLEASWARTDLGFDSCDHILDIEAANDLSRWRWKDEDEFEWARSVGIISENEAETIRGGGKRVISLLKARQFPLLMIGQWQPEPLSVPSIPEGWNVP